MSDVWRCAVCEGVNTGSPSCATCGAPRSVAARRATAAPAPGRAPAAPRRAGDPTRGARAARPARTVDRLAGAARTVAVAQAERLEQMRRLARERREAELLHREREPAPRGYDEEESGRPRLRVIPTPFGCLFSLGPRRRRRWR